MARRIAETYSVDYRMLRVGSARGLSFEGVTRQTGAGIFLPVLPHPIVVDPCSHPKWDGSLFQVPSFVLAEVSRAHWPYILKFGRSDTEGRLRKADLILMSQTPGDRKKIVVVSVSKHRKCFLARWREKRWVTVADGKSYPDAEVVGHCIGVLWSALVEKE